MPAHIGGNALIAVVSDGAGSARLSRLGSRIVTDQFCRSAGLFLGRGGHAAALNDEVAGDWLDNIRDRIEYAAQRRGEIPKALAATLVGIVVQRDFAVVVHVGDGACAVRLLGEKDWWVPSWPAMGEYASTTYFVTDDPRPRTVISAVAGVVEEVALFTDGLERLALDFLGGVAYQRFFETMFPALRRTKQRGRDRKLSRDLRAFLDSTSVTDRTDDDKSLIMARRENAE